MLTHRVTFIFFYFTIFSAAVPFLTGAQPLAPVHPSEQLTSQDVSKIVALLGGSPETDVNTKTAEAISLQSEGESGNKEKPRESTAPSEMSALPVPKAILPNSVPTQDDIAQSLSMLNTLVNSGGISAETLKLLGLNSLTQTATTTTTTTTENPNVGETQQALALINALLGASGDSTAASSSSDAASLAALLSLASAAPQQQQPGTQQQSAADAALLTNLLLSSAAAAGTPDQSKVKQQDFQNFQNAGLSLDSASSNQLSGILGLLGSLGSLGGSPQSSSIFNLGQQAQQPNLLAGLLGGGGGQAQANLLGGLLASASGQQAQKPGLLSSLGTLASVVGTSLSQGDGKPRVRGVDTRLGLGYRFGENADAQVVWEIGPQLFTEPLSNEQKQQILLQQQQQQLQRRHLQNKANKRVYVHKTTRPTRQPVRSHSPMSRRQLAVSSNSGQFIDLSKNSYITYQNAPAGMVQSVRHHQSSPSTLHRVAQSSPKLQNHGNGRPHSHHHVNMKRDPENDPNENNANYYAKKEGNPRVNRDSQLTDYERWLLTNPNRDQIHQQQLLVNANSQQNNNNRKDAFIFSKDNANNIVRVRIQPRESPRQVQIYQAVSGMNDNQGKENRIPLTPINKLSHRMGSFGDTYNPAADDSYSRRNAMVHNPGLREMERQRERQQHIHSVQQRRGGNSKGEANRRVSNPVASTLSEWSEKNSFFDVMQNYVLTSLQSEGNNLVKSFFQAREAQEKKQRQPTTPSSDGQVSQVAMSKQQQKKPSSGGSKTGIIPSLKSLLGHKAKTILARVTTVRPVIKVGDDVSYEDLKLMLNGGQQEEASRNVPTYHEASVMTHKGEKTKTPEIFIDIENGEVSMMKPFGSMESFTPPPPEIIPEDSPKHVFQVLQEQLKEQYEKVKMEQLKEAAKQRRKENLINGLSNPNDPLYLASKYFELLEKES